MCGRYTNTVGPEELNDRFNVPIISRDGTRRFNIAPTEEVLAILAPEGAPEARMLRWGLIPPWAKDLKSGYKMINARMETVASRSSYRALLPKGSRRALQIADGWYEWLKPERHGAQRQPFLFRVDGGLPFAFAALWTPAYVKGERVESVVMLTCSSERNRVAAAIHDRMPVVLADRDAQDAWLSSSLNGQEALSLCGAVPEGRLSATAANPAVNRARGPGGPELLIAPAQC